MIVVGDYRLAVRRFGCHVPPSDQINVASSRKRRTHYCIKCTIFNRPRRK